MSGAHSAEEELVLLLAGTRAQRSQADLRIRALAATASFDVVAELLGRHRLTVILGSRAQALGLTPASFDASLLAAGNLSERRAFVLDTVTREVLAQLEGEGIPTLPLKGTGLSVAAHGALGARLSQDVDVLVPNDKVDAAVRALAPIGYRVPAAPPHSTFHVTLEHAEPWRPPVEVHWQVHWYGRRFATRMLNSARIDEDGVRSAHTAATLVALLLFYARDGFAGLRLAVDIASYVDAIGEGLQPADVLSYVAEDPEIGAPVHAALRVVQSTVGVELGVAPAPLRRRDGLAIRLANWRLHGEPDQIRATVRLVDALLAPSTRWPAFVASRFTPFQSRAANVVYLIKTLLRWLPAFFSILGRGAAHPVPRER